MIKIGTYLMSNGELSLEERIAATKAAGFDFAALGLGLFASDEVEKAAELCAKHSLPVDNIHLTGSKTTLIWNDGEEGDAICERICREIERASAAGIKAGVAHITWGHSQPAPMNETSFARYVRIAQTAERCNFILGLENSVFIDYLYATMEHLRDFKSIGYTYDSGHHNAFAPERDLLRDFGDRLIVTHIQDNNGIDDLHMPPFDGNVDWNYVADGLARTQVGRNRICAEIAAGSFKELKGMTEAEARDCIARLPVSAHSPELVSFDGNKVAVGKDLTYEEKLERLYEKMKKLASMIEAKI